MLLRLDARGVHQAFAEMQEAANFEAEVRERPVINGPQRRRSHMSDIISYYDTYVCAVMARVCSIGRAIVTAVCGRPFAFLRARSRGVRRTRARDRGLRSSADRWRGSHFRAPILPRGPADARRHAANGSVHPPPGR